MATWNLWWRFGGDWRRRHDAILVTLRRCAPEVIGLQEVWAADGTDQAAVFATALGMHSAYAGPAMPPTPRPPEEPSQEGVALGVGLLSRWPITAVEHAPLPSPARGHPPVALTAAIAHPAGPLHVVVACTEWETAYADDHLRQTRALAALLGDHALDGSLPVLLAADLNAPPGSDALRPLEEIAVDTWAAAGGDPRAATLSSRNPHAPTEVGHLIDRRIDHVLARPGEPGRAVTASSARLFGEAVSGVFPSDHFGVLVEVGGKPSE